MGRPKSIDIGDGEINYIFADGRSVWVLLAGRRQINGGTGDIVIIGHDDRGPFVAGYTYQDGMPPGCYVDNSPGVDRGGYIELRGILWAKAANFKVNPYVSAGNTYPGGTRFCFGSDGLVWATTAG